MTSLKGGRSTPGQTIVYGLLCLLAGLALGGVATVFGVQTVKFFLQAQRAQGTVVRLAQKNTYYYPVIAYTTALGQAEVITDTQGSNPPAHQVNDVVPVLYLPAHPDRAQENSFLNLWLTPALPLLLALFFAVSGGIVLADGVKRLRSSPQ